jgi:hypothetical protein
LWLDILPGAAVVLGGLIMMQSSHRVSGTVGCWLAMAGGAWFAVGPAVSRLWEHSAGPIGAALYGTTRQVFELVGYYYGLGVVVVGLAAFALGRFVTRPAIVTAPAEEPAAAPTAEPYEPVDSEPATTEHATTEPAEAEPATTEHATSGPAEAESGTREPSSVN